MTPTFSLFECAMLLATMATECTASGDPPKSADMFALLTLVTVGTRHSEQFWLLRHQNGATRETLFHLLCMIATIFLLLVVAECIVKGPNKPKLSSFGIRMMKPRHTEWG